MNKKIVIGIVVTIIVIVFAVAGGVIAYRMTRDTSKPEDVLKDEEGMQTMRTLGNNMAWLLKCIEAGKNEGVNLPKNEDVISTNFIR